MLILKVSVCLINLKDKKRLNPKYLLFNTANCTIISFNFLFFTFGSRPAKQQNDIYRKFQIATGQIFTIRDL